MAYVIYEKIGHVGVITLNRPERMSALGRELGTALREAEAEFVADDDVWIGIYTGAGDRAFCAGRDLKEAAEFDASGEGMASASGGSTSPVSRFELIAPDHGKPTIAAINGAAYGGGLEMALTNDIRIAARGVRMALAEVKVGLCPRGGSFNLPRLIGLSNAMWLLLSGEPVDADEALRIGLVTRVVPQEELMPTAMAMAETIARNAPLAVRATRKLAHLGLEMPKDYAQRMGAALIESVWTSEDSVEGAKAFAEKREPQWRMR
ncbi:MAG: enoyl-CoA hydratase-related protein [Chloroflexi bacterium]|nr:enoyl-CoA hydratase-related protein [Chloroflexota bacterium]MDA1147436.1 enoyl-CoA hydratase-related protein [Chloroflexota bacterium]